MAYTPVHLVGVSLARLSGGVCYLEFTDDDLEQALARLQARWPGAELVASEGQTAQTADGIFHRSQVGGSSLHLLVRGTNFQVQVWNALMRIPQGHLMDYAGVARWIGNPAATRAVGTAIGANPIAWLIPCHRVLRGDGSLGGYRWGTTRKSACLLYEQGRCRADQR